MNLSNIELKDFMCGCLLGNGNIIKKYQNASYKESLKKNKEEYLIWKKKVIEKNLDTSFKFYNKKYYNITSTTHNYFTKMFKIFYIENKKIFPIKFINKYFNIIGLSILYMDCGKTYWRKEYGTIKMCELSIKNFSLDEILIFQKILIDKFNIYSNISFKNKFIFRFYGENAKKLIKIIFPIVSKVECMRYKIDFNYYINNKIC